MTIIIWREGGREGAGGREMHVERDRGEEGGREGGREREGGRRKGGRD